MVVAWPFDKYDSIDDAQHCHKQSVEVLQCRWVVHFQSDVGICGEQLRVPERAEESSIENCSGTFTVLGQPKEQRKTCVDGGQRESQI